MKKPELERERKMERDELYLQLNKLSAITSEESLDQILTTLWKTRRTGLGPPEKSQLRSLLSLSSVEEVDPVSACLRSLVRKCLHEDFTREDLIKLFPPDLSLSLQDMLTQILLKHKSSWKEEMSREQHLLPRTRVFYQVKTNVPQSFTAFPSSHNSTSSLANQNDPIARLNPSDLEVSASMTDNNMGKTLRFKSMTWSIENSNSTPPNRMAIVSLKLQDYTKSASGETELKFKLNRDTAESILKSMTHVSEKLSGAAGTSSGPIQKKQKQ